MTADLTDGVPLRFIDIDHLVYGHDSKNREAPPSKLVNLAAINSKSCEAPSSNGRNRHSVRYTLAPRCHFSQTREFVDTKEMRRYRLRTDLAAMPRTCGPQGEKTKARSVPVSPAYGCVSPPMPSRR